MCTGAILAQPARDNLSANASWCFITTRSKIKGIGFMLGDFSLVGFDDSMSSATTANLGGTSLFLRQKMETARVLFVLDAPEASRDPDLLSWQAIPSPTS